MVSWIWNGPRRPCPAQEGQGRGIGVLCERPSTWCDAENSRPRPAASLASTTVTVVSPTNPSPADWSIRGRDKQFLSCVDARARLLSCSAARFLTFLAPPFSEASRVRFSAGSFLSSAFPRAGLNCFPPGVHDPVSSSFSASFDQRAP